VIALAGRVGDPRRAHHGKELDFPPTPPPPPFSWPQATRNATLRTRKPTSMLVLIAKFSCKGGWVWMAVR